MTAESLRTLAQQVRTLPGEVDDGGGLSNCGLAAIDLSGERPYLLREGALSAEEIAAVIGVTAESLLLRLSA